MTKNNIFGLPTPPQTLHPSRVLHPSRRLPAQVPSSCKDLLFPWHSSPHAHIEDECQRIWGGFFCSVCRGEFAGHASANGWMNLVYNWWEALVGLFTTENSPTKQTGSVCPEPLHMHTTELIQRETRFNNGQHRTDGAVKLGLCKMTEVASTNKDTQTSGRHIGLFNKQDVRMAAWRSWENPLEEIAHWFRADVFLTQTCAVARNAMLLVSSSQASHQVGKTWKTCIQGIFRENDNFREIREKSEKKFWVRKSQGIKLEKLSGKVMSVVSCWETLFFFGKIPFVLFLVSHNLPNSDISCNTRTVFNFEALPCVSETLTLRCVLLFVQTGLLPSVI